METKQFFISISFAIVTTMLINYFIIDRFFYKDTQEIKSGQAFHVTPLEQINKPVAKEVNFLDEDTAFFEKNEPEMTQIKTRLMDVIFSSRGALVNTVVCKKVSGHVEVPLEIIHSGQQATVGMFLVALSGATPMRYTRESKHYENGIHTIVYVSKSQAGLIRKEFTLYDDSYLIDMRLTIEPVGVQTPRIIFAAPHLKGLENNGAYTTALVNGQHDMLQRFKQADVIDKVFAVPTLCGIADRYFVNAFIKNSTVFAQRCYFIQRHDQLNGIIEGPEVSTKASWTLTWYCGPKEFEPLQKADHRLTELLDYGWFTMLARPLLFTLKRLYDGVHNFGLAIIILTLLLNLIMLPFTSRGEKSLQKATDFSKKMHYLEQKYKHDKERLAQEKADLMQKHGNFDLLGCFSFVLQAVFFIGLNKVLSSSIELYHAPFYGWIVDLSAKDPYFLLPLGVLVGIIVPALNSSDVRQRATSIAVGLLFFGIMAQLSAGLVLFILTNIVTRFLVTSVKKVVSR